MRFCLQALGSESLRKHDFAFIAYADRTLEYYDFREGFLYKSRSLDDYEAVSFAYAETYITLSSDSTSDDQETDVSDRGDFVTFIRFTFSIGSDYDVWDCVYSAEELKNGPRSLEFNLVQSCLRIAERMKGERGTEKVPMVDLESEVNRVRSITRSEDLHPEFSTFQLRDQLSAVTSVVLQTREAGWRTQYDFNHKDHRLEKRVPQKKWRRTLVTERKESVGEFINAIVIDPQLSKRVRLASLFDGPASIRFLVGDREVYSISFYKTFTLPRLTPESRIRLLELLEARGLHMEYYR